MRLLCPPTSPGICSIHVHWVRDAFSTSYSLPSPFFAFNLFQHQWLFQWVSSLYQVAKILELQVQHQSFQWILRTDSFRTDWLDLVSIQRLLKILHIQSTSQILSRDVTLKVQAFNSSESPNKSKYTHLNFPTVLYVLLSKFNCWTIFNCWTKRVWGFCRVGQAQNSWTGTQLFHLFLLIFIAV